ncbi:fibronectin type III domain-containing protein 11-like [Rana temporaria]|uniref:fibronectin type III domain-containing protein 11-like n=1 Tax=Rana temporaria TaxID=8407 RepID=UPI001AAD6165|nr:fibronectin type III domain-containing protein 11-like [Rana temporaria]
MDTSISVTSVNTEQDEGERLAAVFNYQKAYLKLIDDHLCMATLKDFEDRLDLLRKSNFFITILPKKTFTGLEYVKTELLLHPQRYKHMKEMGTDQTKMQLFLLEKYLEEMKERRSELVEMVQANEGEFSLTKQQTLNQDLSGLGKLVNDFQNMSVRGPLHIKHQLIVTTTFHHLPSLKLFLNTKRPVTFHRSESMAFDNWTFLSWHVSGHRLLTDSFEVHFQQLNLQSNEEAHSGVYTVEGNTLNIDNLLPEKTYQFSIRRTKTCNQVYDEWCDIITLSTREV